ncbi:MAG: hypothetical protein E4H23_01175 [Chrysiogenales bacterium]|nr:MAG: hypothetical protein E4H23_01175 [Chrysiogenales bacterium]
MNLKMRHYTKKNSAPCHFMLFLCLIAASSCFRIERSVSIVPIGAVGPITNATSVIFPDFRQAFANLDFSGIGGNELDADALALVRGMRLVMAGDMAGAEFIFRKTALTAATAWSKLIASEILVQIFYYQSEWKNLHEMFAPVPGADHAADKSDLSFLELSETKAEYYRFPDLPVILPLELSNSGTPIIRIQINGKWEKFWLDTGSGFTVLSSDLAGKLRISPLTRARTHVITGTNKRVAAQLTVIEKIRIGGIEITQHPAMIVQKKDLFFKIPGQFKSRKITKVTGVTGILGINAIKNLSLRIDYRKRQIILARPDKKVGGERNLFWMGYPILVCRSLNGVRLHFGVDTGAKRSLISPNLFTKIRTKGTYRIRLKVWGAGGEMKIKTQVLPDLKILAAGYLVGFRDIVALPLDQFGFVKLDGILGCDFLLGCGSLVLNLSEGVFSIGNA